MCVCFCSKHFFCLCWIVLILGKGLFRYASQFKHCCEPTCNINVIDEIGTIEVRTLMDIEASNVVLTRNYLENKTIVTWQDTDCKSSENSSGKYLNYFSSLHNFNNSMLIPGHIRRKQLLNCYRIECNCKLCNSIDKRRGFNCKFVKKRIESVNDNNNDCNGVIRPHCRNDKLWKCDKCNRNVSNKDLLFQLKEEKEFERRLIGLESVIEIGFRAIDKSKLLYNLLRDVSLVLCSNHWIIVRLVWICFEEALNKKNLNIATIYLKRHIELMQEMNENNVANISIANKCELLADLADLAPFATVENCKIDAICTAIEMKKVLKGESHSGVKACKKKLYKFENEAKCQKKVKNSNRNENNLKRKKGVKKRAQQEQDKEAPKQGYRSKHNKKHRKRKKNPKGRS